MGELAGEADFALEPLDGGGVRAVGQEQFHGGVAPHERVAGAIDDAHAAFADFFVERVLAELLQLQLGFAQPPAPGEVGVGKNKQDDGAKDEQQKERDEDVLQHAQRPVGLDRVNLSHHADAELGQPAPRADDRHAAIIARGRHVHAVIAIQGFGHKPGQRFRRRIGGLPV